MSPDFFSRARIDRDDDTPGPGRVDDAIDDDRRRFKAALRAHRETPGKPQFPDVRFVDRFQLTEALLAIRPAVREPTRRFACRRTKPRIVDGLRAGAVRVGTCVGTCV